MGSVEVGIDISAPAERVWRALMDIESWPRWTPSVTEVERLESGPLKVGSRTRVKQPRLPVYVWQVTELDEGSSFTWVTHAPGVTAKAGHQITETADGSHLTVSVAWSGPMAGLVGAMYAKRTRESLTQEANGHKAASEASGS